MAKQSKASSLFLFLDIEQILIFSIISANTVMSSINLQEDN